MNTDEIIETTEVPAPKKRGHKPSAKKVADEPVVEVAVEHTSEIVSDVIQSETIKSDTSISLSEVVIDSCIESKNEQKIEESTDVVQQQSLEVECVTESNKVLDDETTSTDTEASLETVNTCFVTKSPIQLYKTPSKKHPVGKFQGVVTLVDTDKSSYDAGFVLVKIKLPGVGKSFTGFIQTL